MAARVTGIGAGLLLSIAAYVLLASWHISLPGPHYDETYQAPPAIALLQGTRPGGQHWVVTIAGRSLPVMSLPYVGSLRTYIFAAVFRVFGPTVPALRLTRITVTAIGLLCLALWARAAFGPLAALVSAWLLATDPSLILATRADWGSVSFAFAFRTSALYFLWRWWTSGRRAPLVIAAALLGSGLYDKTTFAWFLISLAAVGAVAWWTSSARPHVKGPDLALAGGMGLAACSPLLLFNLLKSGQTARFVSAQDDGGWLEFVVREASNRTEVLAGVLSGDILASWMFGEPLAGRFGWSGSITAPLAVVAVLSLVAVAVVRRQWWWALLPAFIVLSVGQIYLMPRGRWVHNWITIYPFPHVAIGLMAALAGSLSMGRLRWRAALAPLTALAILCAVTLNLLTMAEYQRLMVRTGGFDLWSDAVYRVADTLETQYAGRRVQIMEWGLRNQLFMLSNGALSLSEPYARWHDDAPEQKAASLAKLVADPGNLFLYYAESKERPYSQRSHLAAAAEKACATIRREVPFSDRVGRPVLTLVEFAPGTCRQ